MALTDNLVSYWKADEASGNAADSVGSNTGTPQGSAGRATGIISNGLAVALTGAKYYTITDTGMPIGAGARSISCWINLSSLVGDGANGVFFNYGKLGTLSAEFLFGIRGAASNVQYPVIDDYGHADVGGTDLALSTSTWYHIVMTWNGSGGYIVYKNGSSNQTVTKTDTAPNTVLNATGGIGGRQTNIQMITGTIDEIGIWSRVLTSDEVTSLYNSGAGLQYPFSAVAATNNWLLMGV